MYSGKSEGILMEHWSWQYWNFSGARCCRASAVGGDAQQRPQLWLQLRNSLAVTPAAAKWLKTINFISLIPFQQDRKKNQILFGFLHSSC